MGTPPVMEGTCGKKQNTNNNINDPINPPKRQPLPSITGGVRGGS